MSTENIIEKDIEEGNFENFENPTFEQIISDDYSDFLNFRKKNKGSGGGILGIKNIFKKDSGVKGFISGLFDRKDNKSNPNPNPNPPVTENQQSNSGRDQQENIRMGATPGENEDNQGQPKPEKKKILGMDQTTVIIVGVVAVILIVAAVAFFMKKGKKGKK